MKEFFRVQIGQRYYHRKNGNLIRTEWRTVIKTPNQEKALRKYQEYKTDHSWQPCRVVLNGQIIKDYQPRATSPKNTY